MIDLPVPGTIAGGLGLFLLGMGLMTDGLKLAAGPAPAPAGCKTATDTYRYPTVAVWA